MATRRARRGRTPSIDPELIAGAVQRVGRRGPVTMQAVAGALGVDVTTLYRHVGGVDELRRIWATQAAPSVSAWPSPAGQTWESWLAAMAHYYRQALRQNPELIEFAQAALDPDFERLERATRTLVDFGFEPRSAMWVHAFLINNVMGFVQQELLTDEEARRGRQVYARVLQAMAMNGEAGQLPTLRGLELRPEDFNRDAVFERFLGYVIDGIRAQPETPKQTGTVFSS